jgi:hypothetical protein
MHSRPHHWRKEKGLLPEEKRKEKGLFKAY